MQYEAGRSRSCSTHFRNAICIHERFRQGPTCKWRISTINGITSLPHRETCNVGFVVRLRSAKLYSTFKCKHISVIHIKLNLFYSSVYNATTLLIRSYTFTTCFGLNMPSSGISLFAKTVTFIYYSSYILPNCTVSHLCYDYVFADISQPTIHRDLIFTTLD
jgi:hypothetical protein